ncbi:MAG: ABC transporter permease subunit [Actinobacteria bacterium]|nr:ABC transporter permease subunit [Actinomycetota bacterium]
MSAATASRHAAGPVKLTWPGVLRSEWTKLWSLRSSVYTLLAAVAVMIGFGLIFAAAQTAGPGHPGPPGAGDPATAPLDGVYLAQLVIAVQGVLLISGEYATGSIRSTLAAVPSRLPVLWAKGAVLAAVTLTLMAAAAIAAFLGGQAVLSGKHLGASLSEPGMLRAVLGAALYLTVAGLLGLGLGALLRRTAAAIAVAAGLLLVLPILASLLPGSWSSHITKFLPANAGQAILNVHHVADSLSPWAGLALFSAYAVAALAAAAILLLRRDA